MDKTAAAARLGIPEAEVLDVTEGDAGVVIRTFDGQAYIDVPDDSPDGAGKTGLMYLSAPSPSYGGAFPVFVASDEPEADGESERITEIDPEPAKAAHAKKKA